ncbi:MAG: response regulator [Phycisphaerales bacterium]|nr:response regulator [Phycisphaerales bacterium]
MIVVDRASAGGLGAGSRPAADIEEALRTAGSGDTPVLATARALRQYIADSEARLWGRLVLLQQSGAELVSLDPTELARMDVGERMNVLEERFLRVSRDLLKYDHLVVRVLDAGTMRLETLFASGFSEEAKALEIRAGSEHCGISGYVAATGKTYICPDTRADSRYLPGIDNARSSLTAPMRVNDRVVGVLNIESEDLNAFGEEDRLFAEIFASFIAIALNLMQLLIVERNATTGQVAADIDAEVASPLNQIVSDVEAMLATRAGDEDLTQRVRAIVQNVEEVRQAVHAAGNPITRGGAPTKPMRDALISGKRVLVADDEDIIRDTIAEVLDHLGAETMLARDGRGAIDLIESRTFDLVISDIKMPHKNGYEVFSAAKASQPDTPVILITGFGYDPEHSIVRAGREGLAGVLFKPFKVDEMLDLVREALGKAAE